MIKFGLKFFRNGTTSRVEYIPLFCITTSATATSALAEN